jgi:hypothetical protein
MHRHLELHRLRQMRDSYPTAAWGTGGWGMQNCSTFLLPIFQESYTYCAHASCRICGPRGRFLFVWVTAAEFKKTHHEDNTLCLPNTGMGKGNILHLHLPLYSWRASIKIVTRKLKYVTGNTRLDTPKLLTLCLWEYWISLITDTKQVCS